MYKILTSLTRPTGSKTQEGRVVVSSLPDLKRGIKTGTLPINWYFYELDALTQEELDSCVVSDQIFRKIEAKKFKFFHPILENGSIPTGFELSLQSADNNIMDAKMLLRPNSMQLESYFGYWNVYEMDMEKLETQRNVVGDGMLNLYGYSGFTVMKIRIQENGTITSTGNLTISTNYIGDGTNGIQNEILLSVDLVNGMDQTYTVNIDFDMNTQLSVVCDSWNSADVDISIKHTII